MKRYLFNRWSIKAFAENFLTEISRIQDPQDCQSALEDLTILSKRQSSHKKAKYSRLKNLGSMVSCCFVIQGTAMAGDSAPYIQDVLRENRIETRAILSITDGPGVGQYQDRGGLSVSFLTCRQGDPSRWLWMASIRFTNAQGDGPQEGGCSSALIKKCQPLVSLQYTVAPGYFAAFRALAPTERLYGLMPDVAERGHYPYHGGKYQDYEIQEVHASKMLGNVEYSREQYWIAHGLLEWTLPDPMTLSDLDYIFRRPVQDEPQHEKLLLIRKALRERARPRDPDETFFREDAHASVMTFPKYTVTGSSVRPGRVLNCASFSARLLCALGVPLFLVRPIQPFLIHRTGITASLSNSSTRGILTTLAGLGIIGVGVGGAAALSVFVPPLGIIADGALIGLAVGAGSGGVGAGLMTMILGGTVVADPSNFIKEIYNVREMVRPRVVLYQGRDKTFRMGFDSALPSINQYRQSYYDWAMLEATHHSYYPF